MLNTFRLLLLLFYNWRFTWTNHQWPVNFVFCKWLYRLNRSTPAATSTFIIVFSNWLYLLPTLLLLLFFFLACVVMQTLFCVCQLSQSLSSSGQAVVPEELRFPHACCVGIASQTSLSLFNPSERWQQVSITVTGLAIDGEKVSWGSCAEEHDLWHSN